MADALYAQVLAYTSGLGPMVPMDKLQQHLEAVVKYTKTEFGLTIWGSPNDGPVPNTGDQIWQMAPSNQAALGIHSGTVSVADSLSHPNRSISLWRDVCACRCAAVPPYRSHEFCYCVWPVHDQWNVAGIATAGGLPSITSHYGYAFTSWHVMLALTGQDAHLPAGRLVFSPKSDEPLTQFKFPVLLPGVFGTLELADGKYTIQLVVGGPVSITHLEASGCTHVGAVTLSTNVPVTWSCNV